MSLHSSATPSQAVRHGDRAHKASIARQRKAATASPREQAEAISQVIRKRVTDGQPVPDLDKYRLDDDVWAELLDVLTADELGAVADACNGDDFDGGEDEPTSDDITRAF